RPDSRMPGKAPCQLLPFWKLQLALVMLIVFQQPVQHFALIQPRRQVRWNPFDDEGVFPELADLEPQGTDVGQQISNQLEIRATKCHRLREKALLAGSLPVFLLLPELLKQDPFVRRLLVDEDETRMDLRHDITVMQLER